MPSTTYIPGQYNCICDVCGFELKSGEMKRRWDGLMVCPADYELDHPQKYIRVREDGQAVPFVRPEPEDEFVIVCTLLTRQGISGVGIAGCAIAGFINNLPT